MMLADILGVWPGLAALVLAVMAETIVANRLSRAGRFWLRFAYVVLGGTAIVSSIGYQIVVAQERREAQEREGGRDQRIAIVDGKMDALLQLVPGLKDGSVANVAEAREKIAELRGELAELRERAAPRSIPRDQAARFVEMLLTFQGSVDILHPNDTETQNFAVRIANTMSRNAHWRVTIGTRLGFRTYDRGIALERRDNESTRVLHDALKAGDIPFAYFSPPGAAKHESAYLYIGQK